MSVFVSTKCKIADENSDVFIHSTAWSKLDQIVALSVSIVDDSDERETNQILFANNEGEVLPNYSITHDVEATVFDWHPSERTLAIGWDDGMISCWSVDGKSRPACAYSNNSRHKQSITVLKWNPQGKRLVTGDKDGVVCVWQVDSRGSLSPIRHYPQNKKGSISTLVYCTLQPRIPEFNIVTSTTSSAAAATAAKPKVDPKSQQSFSPPFFFGTDRGFILYADDLGHCTDVQQLSSAIDTMLFFNERSRLVIITKSFMLMQYHVSDDGRVTKGSQFKLSVPSDISDRGIQSVVWASPGVLALATEEKMVRVFDIAADENYNLSLISLLSSKFMHKNDKVVSLAFSPVDRYLSLGTVLGLIVVWRFNGNPRDVSSKTAATTPTSAADWEIIFRAKVGGNMNMSDPPRIQQLAWYGGKGCLACTTEDGTFIFQESLLHSRMCGDLSVIQINTTELSVHIAGSLDPQLVNTGMQIRGLTIGRSCFVVWSGKTARIYRVDMQVQRIEALNSTNTSCSVMAIADATHINDEVWFTAEQHAVKISNFSGTIRSTVSFSEAEGTPQFVDVNGGYLAIATSAGVLKIVDVRSPSKPKSQGSVGQFFGAKPVDFSSKTREETPAISADCTRIRLISVNSSGTMVAILTEQLEGALQVCHPDNKLYVFDGSKGVVVMYDFSSKKRCPISIHWDESDSRLLCCEAQKQRQAAVSIGASTSGSANAKGSGVGASANNAERDDVSNGTTATGKLNKKGEVIIASTAATASNDDEAEVEVFLFFATSEQGILIQDSFPRKEPYGTMIGVNVPRLFFRNIPPLKKGDGAEDEDAADRDQLSSNRSTAAVVAKDKEVKIYSKVMRDFIGIDNVDDSIKAALLDFSFNLTLGRLDEAYRVVKAINSSTIWENMAQMCVKTKRLDVAEVCLGNMGHARGAAAVRESKKNDGSLETTIGILAIQLGLLGDAAQLFREAGRYDLLNKLYQSAGLWEKAIAIATTKDRIHLKTTHFQYARHLETIGLIDDAIEHYQLSENSTTEVPRMLFQLGRVEELGEYVLQSEDPVLLKWWAAYLESIERYDKAKKYYNKAKDYLSLVRICCFKGDFDKAAEIVTETGDRASAYHFARHLENQGEYQDAISFFASSGCYNHCIRLARAYSLDAELMRYALKSTPALMVECATHFEDKKEFDKAVQLYHKGGDLPRALELCFRVGEDRSNPHATVVYDMMNMIAQDLGVDSSPQTLARCAEFLVQNKQFVKAIELYVMAKRYNSAVEMCLLQKVTINDDMVEKLTPPESMDPVERKEILANLAKALKKQGSFTLASKKYTLAGDRVRAIKCLVRSGDTKAVIQFASISRNVEIYKLAANYLQQMNWRESVDILKAIITFYTKAKAFMQLAGFYDSCGQVEIDEYRDYEKAIGALREALKYLAKDSSRPSEDMADSIRNRISIIEKFVQAKRCVKKQDPAGMISICQSLLQEPLLEESIRAGDCLAMLVEHFHGAKLMQEAYRYLQEMEERHIQLHPYVDSEVINDIYREVGLLQGGGAGDEMAIAPKFNNNNNNSDEKQDSKEIYISDAKSIKNNTQNTWKADEVNEEIDEEIPEEVEESPPKPITGGRRAGYNSGSRPGSLSRFRL